MKKYILELENVSFKFSTELPYFFHKLKVIFESGKINFIQGNNGIGKSTFFRVIQGDIHSSEQFEGLINFANKQYNVAEKTNRCLLSKNVGLVEQDITVMFADQLSFEENLKIATMDCYPGLCTLPKIKPLPDFVAHFGIDQKKPVYLLSGGQKQILVILMMLQKSKKILLLDEPTAALDEKNAQQVLYFLNEIATKTSAIILIISHDKELVKEYSRGSYYEIYEKDDESRSIRKTVILRSEAT